MIVWKGFADTPDQPGSYWHDTIIQELISRIPIEPNLLITPGHFRDATEINEFIAGEPWIVWVLGDEEGDCPFWDINAPVWAQFPNPHRPYWPDRTLPLGYTPHTRPALQGLGRLQKSGWVLAGQNTNNRRNQAFRALERIDPSRCYPSPTFAGGLEHEAYMKLLAESEWAPCPAGNVRADSFRMWEALEAGAVPILDATTPHGDRNTWPLILGDHPFPVVSDWGDVGDILSQPPPLAGPWYTKYKAGLVKQLISDWGELSGERVWDPPRHRITTIITASPIRSHPSMDILSETVESVRKRLPGNEIIIAFDGSRTENPDYEEHIRRVSYHANLHWPEAWVHYTGKWKHQAGTVKDVIAHVQETVLMVEHDTPLTGEIPFDTLVAALYTEAANVIRLHYDTRIHPDHQYLMKGHLDAGVRLLKTVQYSQRPHLARAAFYRDLLGIVPDNARTYIEDCVYGAMANSPWEHNKLAIYAPEGNMQRSYHLDGRAGEPKPEFWW